MVTFFRVICVWFVWCIHFRRTSIWMKQNIIDISLEMLLLIRSIIYKYNPLVDAMRTNTIDFMFYTFQISFGMQYLLEIKAPAVSEADVSEWNRWKKKFYINNLFVDDSWKNIESMQA